MRKYLVLLIAWALACAFTFASGNDKGENIGVKIQKGEEAKTIIIRLINLEKLATEVVVQDAEGGVWYSEWIRMEAGYATKLDLSTLPNGDYLAFIRNEAGIWVQVFTIAANGIAFFERPDVDNDNKGVAVLTSYGGGGEIGKLIAHFTDKGVLGMGVLLSNLQKQPTTLRMVTLGEGSFYSKTVNGENGFARTLDMNGVGSGDYFLYVHAADATVVQFFTISSENELALGEIQRRDRPNVNIAVPHEDILSSN